jgi:hypothetical protein
MKQENKGLVNSKGLKSHVEDGKRPPRLNSFPIVLFKGVETKKKKEDFRKICHIL